MFLLKTVKVDVSSIKIKREGLKMEQNLFYLRKKFVHVTSAVLNIPDFIFNDLEHAVNKYLYLLRKIVIIKLIATTSFQS